MNDIRRSLLWVVFGMSMILLWDKWQISNGQQGMFFISDKPPIAKTVSPTAQAPASTPSPANFANEQAAKPPAPTVLPLANQTSKELVTVTTDVYQLSFDPLGGSLVRAELLQQRDIVNKKSNMVLLDSSPSRIYQAQTGLIGLPGLPDHKAAMKLASTERELQKGADRLVMRFEAEGGGAKLAKTYTLHRGSYAIDVAHEVTSTAEEGIKPQLYVQLIRDGNKPDGESAFYSTFTGPVVYTEAKKYQKIEFLDIEKNKADFEKAATTGYVGMVQHYFLSAWLPKGQELYQHTVRKVDTNLYAVGMISQLPKLSLGQTHQVAHQLYIGPQEENKLEALAPGLALVKDYGYFTIFSKPLFWLIDKLHDILGNWGWAIVAVVVLLKIAFYWLNAKAYQSMGKMKAINPKVMEMRERLKDNPQKMQQEMMRIYKEEKVNPLGGCLPIMIQIPVFIALYWVLLSSVEFRGAPWVLWIQDLSEPDPWFILPILMTASSLLQTWLNPTPPDPLQAKMMWILPLVFSFMFFFFPAGLVLYWLVNNILSIAQQWVINKRLGVN